VGHFVGVSTHLVDLVEIEKGGETKRVLFVGWVSSGI